MTEKHTPSEQQSPQEERHYLLGLALAVGRGFWSMLRAGERLLRQPRLDWEYAILESGSDTEIELHALKIAVANVKHCIEPRPLLNGQEKLVLCAGGAQLSRTVGARFWLCHLWPDGFGPGAGGA
jgi:hypothetical protein